MQTGHCPSSINRLLTTSLLTRWAILSMITSSKHGGFEVHLILSGVPLHSCTAIAKVRSRTAYCTLAMPTTWLTVLLRDWWKDSCFMSMNQKNTFSFLHLSFYASVGPPDDIRCSSCFLLFDLCRAFSSCWEFHNSHWATLRKKKVCNQDTGCNMIDHKRGLFLSKRCNSR